MTVGAVIVPRDAEGAVTDAAGRAAVRRIVDVAWAGGAMPIIVVAGDPGGAIAALLAGSPASLIDGEDGVPAYRAGAAAAADSVLEMSAVVLWPGRMTWVDPETVTSLIEAHGRTPASMFRPSHDSQHGWPVLIPAERVASVLAADGSELGGVLAAATDHLTLLELGDPGSVLGSEVDLDDLPTYHGPSEPVGGPPPEWGAAAAETPDTEGTD